MAGSVNFVLPQYQADVYDAQRRMALAQALQQQAMAPTDTQGWNQMAIVPKLGLAPGLAKLGETLISQYAMKGAIKAQRDVGMKQWQGLQQMFGGGAGSGQAPGSAPSPDTSGGTQPGSYVAPQGNPMNPLGLPPAAAAMGFMSDPSGYMKDAVYGPTAARVNPTDFTKQLIQMGVDPNSALGHQLMQDQIAKQNYIAPTALRGGGYMYDPKTGALDNLPQTPEGFQTVRGPNGQWMQVPVQGGLGAITSSEAAKAGGKAMYDLTTGFDANGNPITTTTFNQANAANGTGGAPAGMGGALPSQLPTGTDDLYKGYVKDYQDTLKSAANANQDIQAFRAIDQAASQAKTGAGFDRMATIKSFAAVIPGISPNNSDKVNADIISKYANQIAGRNGGRSDAALETALHSITNAGMSPEAIHELTPSLIGLRMADVAKAQAAQSWMQQNRNNPGSLGAFQNRWNKVYDPDVFRFQAMSPEQRTQFKAGLSQQQQQAFRQKIQGLQELGAL